MDYGFYMQAKPISRGGGRRSSVAASAYRAAELLRDEYNKKTFTYRHRHDEVHGAWIITPKKAPDWASDRQELWNRVELSERRKDSQLARELKVQFPHELSVEDCSQIMWDFCEQQIAPLGMIADAALHAPGKGDDRNLHGHIMLTMRHLEPDGFGNKNRAWNANAILDGWKADWERRCNEALAKIGSDRRFDRRSLKARRKEQLDAANAASNWIERRRFEIKAERLNYIPRPNLPQIAYRAMIEGREVPEEYKDKVLDWELARESKIAAKDRAAQMEIELEAEIAAAEAGQQPLEHDTAATSLALPDLERVNIKRGLHDGDPLQEIDAKWTERALEWPERAGLAAYLAQEWPDALAFDLVVEATDPLFEAKDDPSHPLHALLDHLREIGQQTINGGWRSFRSLARALFTEDDLRRGLDPKLNQSVARQSTPLHPAKGHDAADHEEPAPDKAPDAMRDTSGPAPHLPPEAPEPTKPATETNTLDPTPAEDPLPTPSVVEAESETSAKDDDLSKEPPKLSEPALSDDSPDFSDPRRGSPRKTRRSPSEADVPVPPPAQPSGDRWTPERREEDRRQREEARKAAEAAHRARVAAEDEDTRAEAIDLLFRPQIRFEDGRWDDWVGPAGEWIIAFSLRAMDTGQPELQALLRDEWQLDSSDPLAFRSKLNSREFDLGGLATAVDDLDRRMIAAKGDAWRDRRNAFTNMIEFYRLPRMREVKTESAVSLFETTIRNICERTGLADFYRNTLVPLVNRMAEALRLKPVPALPKPDPDPGPVSGGSGPGGP